jgi:hypothetical protein
MNVLGTGSRPKLEDRQDYKIKIPYSQKVTSQIQKHTEHQ